MQAANDPQGALDLVEDYMARYGNLDTAEADKMILLNAIRKRSAPPSGDVPDSTGIQP